MISSHHTSPTLGVCSSLELLESICTYDDLRIWNSDHEQSSHTCVTESQPPSVTRSHRLKEYTEQLKRTQNEVRKQSVVSSQACWRWKHHLASWLNNTAFADQHNARAPDDECCNTSIPLALLIHTTAPDSGTRADTGQTIPTYLQHSVTDSFSDSTHDEFHFLAFPACHNKPALRTPEAMGTRRQRFLLFPAHFPCLDKSFTMNKMNVFCSFVYFL